MMKKVIKILIVIVDLLFSLAYAFLLTDILFDIAAAVGAFERSTQKELIMIISTLYFIFNTIAKD